MEALERSDGHFPVPRPRQELERRCRCEIIASQRCGHETALRTSVGQTGVLLHFATGSRRGGAASGTRNFRYGLAGRVSMLGWCLLGALAAGPLFANGMADAIYDPKSWVSVGLSSPSRGRGQRLTLAFSFWAQLTRRRRRVLSVPVLAPCTLTPVNSNLLAHWHTGGQKSYGL